MLHQGRHVEAAEKVPPSTSETYSTTWHTREQQAWWGRHCGASRLVQGKTCALPTGRHRANGKHARAHTVISCTSSSPSPEVSACATRSVTSRAARSALLTHCGDTCEGYTGQQRCGTLTVTLTKTQTHGNKGAAPQGGRWHAADRQRSRLIHSGGSIAAVCSASHGGGGARHLDRVRLGLGLGAAHDGSLGLSV